MVLPSWLTRSVGNIKLNEGTAGPKLVRRLTDRLDRLASMHHHDPTFMVRLAKRWKLPVCSIRCVNTKILRKHPPHVLQDKCVSVIPRIQGQITNLLSFDKAGKTPNIQGSNGQGAISLTLVLVFPRMCVSWSVKVSNVRSDIADWMCMMRLRQTREIAKHMWRGIWCECIHKVACWETPVSVFDKTHCNP